MTFGGHRRPHVVLGPCRSVVEVATGDGPAWLVVSRVRLGLWRAFVGDNAGRTHHEHFDVDQREDAEPRLRGVAVGARG